MTITNEYLLQLIDTIKAAKAVTVQDFIDGYSVFDLMTEYTVRRLYVCGNPRNQF